MAALPKQVEQDLADLEAYEAQLNAEKNPQPAEPEAQTPAEPAVAQPESQPKPAQPAEPKPADPNWEQKYRTLQGMFDSQVPQLHSENKALRAQMAQMQEQFAALQRPADKAPATERLVTEKDETEYGKELLDVMDRAARQVVREQVRPLQAELKERDREIAALRAAQTNTTGEVAVLTFEQRLARAIPDFEQINVDPKWIAWLDEIDPYTKEPRKSFATFVYQNGDITKLKQVVDFYKESTGVNSASAEAAERQQRNAELQRQITPTRANSTPSADPKANTRLYSEAEMEAGFNKVRALNVKGKLDEAAKLEAELTLAYMENRVRG